MLKQFRLALVLAGAMVAGAAAAQTSGTPMPAGPGGLAFLTDQAVGQFRASKFIGLNVYGPDSQKVGDINDVLVDGSGTARAVVIGVGGFLGIGEKNVALPWSALTWANTRNAAPAGSAATSLNPSPVPTTASVDPSAGTTNRTARTPDQEAAYNGHPDHATITLTKADLQNAPAFKYYADSHPASAAAPGTAAPAGATPNAAGNPAPAPRP